MRFVACGLILASLTSACRPSIEPWDASPLLRWAVSTSGPVAYDETTATFVTFSLQGEFHSRLQEQGMVLSSERSPEGWRLVVDRDDAFYWTAIAGQDVRSILLASPVNFQRRVTTSNEWLAGWDVNLFAGDSTYLLDTGLVYWDRNDGGSPRALNLIGPPEEARLGDDEAENRILAIYSSGWLHVFRAHGEPVERRLPLSTSPSERGPARWMDIVDGRILLLFPQLPELYVISVPESGQLTLNIVTLPAIPADIGLDRTSALLRMAVHADGETMTFEYDLDTDLLSSTVRLPLGIRSPRIRATNSGVLYWSIVDSAAIWKPAGANEAVEIDFGFVPEQIFGSDSTSHVLAVANRGNTPSTEANSNDPFGGEICVAELASGNRFRATILRDLDFEKTTVAAGYVFVPSTDGAVLIQVPMDGRQPTLFTTDDLLGQEPDEWHINTPRIESLSPMNKGLWIGLYSGFTGGGGVYLEDGKSVFVLKNAGYQRALDAPGPLP